MVPGRYLSAIARAVSRRAWCSAQATCRRRGFPEDRRAVLGDLDEFGCNDGIEPDEICEHLLGFLVLHTEDCRPRIFKYGTSGTFRFFQEFVIDPADYPVVTFFPTPFPLPGRASFNLARDLTTSFENTMNYLDRIKKDGPASQSLLLPDGNRGCRGRERKRNPEDAGEARHAQWCRVAAGRASRRSCG